MNSIVAWFARNHVAANLLMASIMVAGLLSLRGMKIEIFPDTSLDMIQVSVLYPGAAPAEVEDGIILRVEEAIQDLEGIKRITSTASENVGNVVIEVEAGYNPRLILDDVKVRVDAIDTFPEESEKPIIQELILRNQVLSVAITGEIDETTLRRLADLVREEMMAWPGITQVAIAGVRPYEIGIEISEHTLRRYGLGFDEVAEAVRRSSLDLPGGLIKAPGGEMLLRTKGQAYRRDDFERIVLITRPDGTRLTLGEVATVIDGFEETPVSSAFDGRRAALVNVFRVGDQNALEVAHAAHAFVDAFRDRLPEGVELHIWKDDSVYLQERLTLLIRNALQGLLLVFLVLALFLRFNLAFWVTLGIPLSFLGAFALFPLLGVSINMISLFALILVLGIVVDDAIVVGESVYTQSQKIGAGVEAAVRGTQLVAIPVTFAVLTTMAAFTPMMNIPGVAGKIWIVIPLTVIPCLFFSMIESKLVLPAHLSSLRTERSDKPLRGITGGWRWLRRKVSDGLERFVRIYYRRSIFFLTQHRYATVTCFLATLAVAVMMLATGWMKFVFFPDVPADFIIARVEMPIGTPVERTAAAVGRIEQSALRIKEEMNTRNGGDGNDSFNHILATVGSQPYQQAFELDLAGAQGHIGEVVIELAPATDRDPGVTSARVESRWRELVGNIPGAVELNFTSRLVHVGKPVDIALSGPNMDILAAAAAELREKLADYAGVYDITDNFRAGKEELQLEILPAAEALGLSLSDLARQVRQAFYGEEAQRIQRGRDEIKVLVRYPLEQRRSIADLDNLRIRTADGTEVPFRSVGRVIEGRDYAVINRLDRRRAVNITTEVDNNLGNAPEILKDLENNFIPALLARYPGIRYSVEGQAREQAETLDGIADGTVFAAFMIFALMAVPFRSYLQPFILMAVIPFGIIGAMIGHFIMGIPISMLSLCGIVALAGVVVNDGLVLIDYMNQNRDRGLPLGQSVRVAGARRFRAIILTSLTTFVGLLPLLTETSTQAQFLKPMAVSLGFGVLFATALNLILVPCLYLILIDIQKIAGLQRWRS